MTNVAVVDIGIGNVHSVMRALAHVGAKPELTQDPTALRNASHVVFPGVGAFGDCAKALESRGLREPLLELLATGKLVLGLCVGMQLLFEGSDEFGSHIGLGYFKGRVSKLPVADRSGRQNRIPHVAWADVEIPQSISANLSLYNRLPNPFCTYFVHSYAVPAAECKDAIGVMKFGDTSFVAVAARGNVFAAQFHPEKSAGHGLRMLENFVNL